MTTNQPQLDDTSRTKLDGIVQQMVANKEPDTNIQAVVNDFKQKYAKPVDTPPQRTFLQKAAGFILDPVAKLATETGNFLGKGIVKGVEQFQNPQQKVQTEQGLQTALNTSSTVPGLGTPVKALNQVTPRDVVGQSLETAATFAPGAAKGASLLTKSAVGAGTGYAFDVANNLQNPNKTLGESFKPGLGTVTGGILPSIGKGLSKLGENLPTWFTKSALPKLNVNKGNIDETLNKLDYGSISHNLDKSSNSVSNLGQQVDTILQKPEYANIKVGTPSVVEKGGQMISDVGIIQNTLSAFPKSEYTPEHIISEMKALVPSEAKTINKIADGTATLLEANELKKEIYSKTRNVFENIGTPSSRKEIGATFATQIADKIKNSVDETKPIFQELSKEINLRNALIQANKKAQANAKLGLYDIAGYFSAGLPGIIGERVARSPGIQTSAAKLINKASNSPILPKVGDVLKRPLLKGVANLLK